MGHATKSIEGVFVRINFSTFRSCVRLHDDRDVIDLGHISLNVKPKSQELAKCKALITALSP